MCAEGMTPDTCGPSQVLKMSSQGPILSPSNLYPPVYTLWIP